MKTAEQIVTAAIDAAGQAGGIDEVERIARRGTGSMTFSDDDVATLLDAYGSPGDALYAIQLEAQRRVSANDRPTPTYPEALRKATEPHPDGGPSMLRIFHLLTRDRS
jgi:hypothetical protein